MGSRFLPWEQHGCTAAAVAAYAAAYSADADAAALCCCVCFVGALPDENLPPEHRQAGPYLPRHPQGQVVARAPDQDRASQHPGKHALTRPMYPFLRDPGSSPLECWYCGSYP